MQTDATSLFMPFRFSSSERKVFEKKERLTLSQWVEKYERWISISDKPGPWRHENNPALKGLMDLFEFARKHIVIVKGVQTGGTEAVLNYAFYKADTSSGMCLLIMESERKVKKMMNNRIIPVFEKTPQLKALISTNPDDTTNYGMKLKNGFILNAGWSTSQSATSSDPCETVIIDELDKSKTAINIQEAKDRINIYERTGKVIMLSTPGFERGPIMNELADCEVIYDYHVACPECGKSQVMKFDNFTWPHKSKPPVDDSDRKKLANEIERDELAEYICEHCGVLWSEYDRNKALADGKWLPRHPVLKRPISIGIVFPAWNSKFRKMSKTVARWLRAQGDTGKLRGWYNNEAAQPFVESEQGESVQEDVLYKRRYDYGPANKTWHIPLKACVLTAFVDVQQNRLETEIVAWGINHESWGIEYRQFPGDPSAEQVWNDLDAWLLKDWFHESGAKMKIAICGIDSGFKAAEVYRFVRKRQARRVYACKGSSTRGKPLISMTMRNMRKNLKDRSRVTLIMLGTEAAKDSLYSWMQTEEAGPRYMHFHNGYGYDYFRMLTAEQAVTRYDKGRPYRMWVKKHPDARNEALDIRVGNYAMLELLNPDYKAIAESLPAQPKEKAEPQPDPPKINKGHFPAKRKGGWVKNWK